jgi:signal transduction histidine kinase
MDADLPRSAAFLRPLVDAVARAPASVHAKLRAAFLASSFLLVAVAIAGGLLLAHMSAEVDQLRVQQQRVDLARQMIYLVTAQSHYRAMALLTHDDTNNQDIATAKEQFLQQLDQVEAISPPDQRGFFVRVREVNDRYAASGAQVLALYQAGDNANAMALHLGEEHPISHELEAAMNSLIAQAEQDAASASASVETSERVLTVILGVVALLGLLGSLLLGFVFAWSITLPVRRIDAALADIAVGRFGQRVEVPNRDEFGTLTTNLNAMSRKLADMYGELQTLNARLQGTNTQLLEQLQDRVDELARSRRLITVAEERVRREIAELLHSRVQNRLLLVWYRLEECEEQLASDPDAARRLVGEVRQQVDEIRERDVRELSHRLHPSIIRAGLVPALDRLVEDFEAELRVSLRVDDRVADLDQPARAGIPEAVRLSAYRVVEEALGNVARHAHVDRAGVVLEAASPGTALSLTVHDDGSGFDPDLAREGLGLGSIAAHVGRVGGTWRILSQLGRGTTLEVRLPLVEPRGADLSVVAV